MTAFQATLSDYVRLPGHDLYVFVGQSIVPGAIVVNSLIRVLNTSDCTDCRYATVSAKR